MEWIHNNICTCAHSNHSLFTYKVNSVTIGKTKGRKALIDPIVVLIITHQTYKNLKEIANYYNSLPQMGKYKVNFCYRLGKAYEITASAGLCFSKNIWVNNEWANLLIKNNIEINNAFFITLGHELAHKDGDFAMLFWERKRKRYIHKEDRKFVNWVTEVHHDFAAAEKMVGSSKEKLIESIDYKIAVKPNNTDSPSHPSWKQRKLYAEIGAFNRKLIDIIALDTDCTNITLIEEVSCFYKDIILMD